MVMRLVCGEKTLRYMNLMFRSATNFSVSVLKMLNEGLEAKFIISLLGTYRCGDHLVTSFTEKKTF